ncbi:hypothetical protein CLV58_1301, partial [Spirosoma oryzae]
MFAFLLLSLFTATQSFCRNAKLTPSRVNTEVTNRLASQLPVPTSLTISGQPNPGGTKAVTVPPNSFTGTDADGTVNAIRYTAFPSNVTSLTIGTTPYTATSFPSGGVSAVVGTTVRIDPVDGTVTVNFPFHVIDNTSDESTVTATLGVPFLVVTDFCNSQVLFFNEDFGAGTGYGPPLSTSVVPGYTYRSTDPINDGQYGIVNNPDQGDDFGGVNNVWLHGPDHTGNPNGRMLVINGSNPNQIAYTQPVSGLVIGRFYSLRTYIANIFNEAVLGTGEIKPNLILRVSDANNNVLASVSTGNIPAPSTLTWLPQSMSFTASTNSVKFELVSNAPAGNGNDFALDDIQFFEVIQPVLSTTAVTSACPATSVSLAAITVSNQPASTTLTWHSSATATAANRITDVSALRSGTYYAAFYDGTCFTKASPVVVVIVPCASSDAGLTVSSAVSSTVVANVAANDLVNGQSATLGNGGNATVAQVGTYPTGVTLDPNTGSLSVAAGTAPGSYTVTYQLCDKLTPVNCTTATATFSVTSLTIAGSVYNDANGLTDSQINGTAYTAGGLFAILTNAASTSVLANAPVSTGGSYSFTVVNAGTYSVRLSTTSAVVGTTPPTASAPTGYTFTGEGTGTTSDGTPNGITPVTLTGTTSQTAINFGLNQLPVPTSLTLSAQANSGGSLAFSIPPSSFTGTDADGTISAIRYTAFPTNVTSLTIGTTAYTSSTFPANGVTVAPGTAVRIDPNDGKVTAGIPFHVIDNAGIESTTTATLGVPFLLVTDFCNSQVLFFNEDFGAGTGFGLPLPAGVTNYNYSNTDPTNDGSYAIVNNPDQADDFATANVWLHGPDHTGNPNGRMLVINGSNPNQVAYSEPVSGLVIGRFYSLRTYVANIFNEAVLGTGEIKPNLILRVSDANNNVLASVSTGDIAPATTLTWLPQSMSFTASTNSVRFELVSNAPAGRGNDYALDDIQFFEVIQPVLSTTAVTSTCPATSVSLATITVSNQPASTTLTWHSSATATAANRITDVSALRSGTYYAAFYDGTCFTKASPVVVVIVPCASPDAGLTVSSAISSTVVANVAANDLVNGQSATLGNGGNATVAQVGTYPTGVTLDPNTGSLSVAAGTAPGSYTVTYQLCDKLTPVNCTTAIATFAVTPVISGTVYNDGNGLTDSQINGTAYTAGGLFAILTNAASTSVLASVPVSSNGVYSFTGLSAGTYSVRLSTTSAVVGSTPPAVSVPTGYTTTGEGIGTTSDGTPDGITPVTLTNTASQTAVNFGLNQLPVPTSATLVSQVNPGGLTSVTIPPASFTGTDADGTVAAIRYTAFPTNANSITIGNTVYVLSLGVGIPVGAVVFPAGGVTATTGTAVSVDPVDGNVTVAIPFRVIDNAGVESTTATTGSISVPFTGLVVSGTVLNDGNGLTDNTINGTGTNAGGLFVNLVNGSGNVVASQAVPATGVYSFTGVAAGTYSVQLSTSAVAAGNPAPAVSVPTGWTFTGEGTTPAGDGTPNGITPVTVTTASSTSVNFGLDQLPVPTSAALTAQANPGGTNAISVPPASFTGTDADGSVTAIRFTTFPTNVASLTIGTTAYTSTSFPAGGVTALTGSTVLIDPIDGPVTVSIPFRAIDNARQESTATGSISVPFTSVVTASPDAGTASAGTGGTPVANVAANDVVNGQPATLGNGGNATVAQVGTYPPGISLNPANGSLLIAAGTAPGSYTVAYQLCDRLSTPTCSTAVVSLTVTASSVANPDAGTVSAGTGGTPVANVTANDVVNGQPATLGTNGNATVAQVGNYPTGISLNPATGSVSVAAGTPPGSYTVAYQLCDKLTPVTCTTGVVSFTVTPAVTASPDAGTASAGTGGTPVANVAANDVVNGQPATLGNGGNATVAQVGTYPTGISLNPATGSVSVAAGTPPGSYTVAYQLCDKLTPVTCTTGVVSFTVTPAVTASPDAGTASAGTGGTPVANVAANDVVNGQPATLGNGGNATVAQVGTYPTGISLNPATGSVSVAAGTAPGSYTLAYQLCDKLTPVTCTTGVVSFTVTPAVTASPDAGTASAGTGGTPVANVAANDVVNGQPATLGTNGNATVAQVGTYPTGISLNPNTGSVSVAAGTAPGSYTLAYQLCDKLTPVTCTTGVVSFTVTPAVTASPDAGTASAGTGGTPVANVAANDVVNGQPATLGTNGNATVAQVGTYPTGISLNPATGSVSVAAGTAPGSYTLAYQLCDKLTPVTCTTAIVSLTVTASSVANPDAGTASAGTGGTPVANVAANDVVNGQPATLGNGGNATVA